MAPARCGRAPVVLAVPAEPRRPLLVRTRRPAAARRWRRSPIRRWRRSPAPTTRADVAHALDGFGFLVPEKEHRRILGTIFSSTLFENRAPAGTVLLTTFVGGMRQPELARRDEAAIAALVQEELAACSASAPRRAHPGVALGTRDSAVHPGPPRPHGGARGGRTRTFPACTSAPTTAAASRSPTASSPAHAMAVRITEERP